MNVQVLDFRGIQNVFSVDDKLSSHPVYIPVSHPNEINEIFDLISYAKVNDMHLIITIQLLFNAKLSVRYR